MKKKYQPLFAHFKIITAALVLLSGCGTESQISTNKKDLALSSSSSSTASSFKAFSSSSTSLSSSSQHKNIPVTQSSATHSTANMYAPISAASKSSISSQALIAISKPSVTQAQSSLAMSPVLQSPLGRISGVVKLTGENGEILSPADVIINIEPTHMTNDLSISQEKHQHNVFMLNKAYTPKLMTMKQNDSISFTNNDKIKHNVFSTSVENRFDLGTYGQGEKNKVALKASGVVKVYCNIHPEMALFISVSPNNYSYITHKNGFYEINNLPLGEYRLTAWHIRGETQQIVNLQDLSTKKDILINTESYVATPHKNKYDENYKVKAVLFEDEFY